MAKRTASYRQGLLERLTDPEEAANYLEAAEDDSTEALLVALRDVAEASKMAKVAKESGVAREALYRMLCETGNPTLTNFKAILRSVGVRMLFAPTESKETALPPTGAVTQAEEVTIPNSINQVDFSSSFTAGYLIGGAWEYCGHTGGLVSNTLSRIGTALTIRMEPEKIDMRAMRPVLPTQ